MAIITSRVTTNATSGSGSITSSTSSTAIIGGSTLFTSQVAYAGIALYTSTDVYIGTVASINSDTSLTLTANAAVAHSGNYKYGYVPKNLPLTNSEIDMNFINLNKNKLEPTDLTTTNTANKGVKRDGNGDFSAGTITAALSGNSSTATVLQTTRKINGVDFNGSANIFTPCTYDSEFKRFIAPGGAIATTTGSSATGAIAITLPTGMQNQMLRMVVKVFEYSSNRSFDIHISGYLYPNGNTWAHNPTVFIIGNPGADRRVVVRLGYDSTAGKPVVYIGELATVWSYPQVWVTECLIGFNGYSESMASGWSITYEASAFKNVTYTSIADTQVGWTAQALQTANNYQGNSFGVGTTASGVAGRIDATTLVLSGSAQNNSLGVGTAASGTAGEIRATNAITSYYSDERLKENIHVIENALDKVEELVGVTYTANDVAASFGFIDKTQQVGVLAGDALRAQPEVVKPAPFDIGIDEEGNEYSISGENYKTVQYEKLVPLLIQAIKELRAEVKELKGIN